MSFRAIGPAFIAIEIAFGALHGKTSLPGISPDEEEEKNRCVIDRLHIVDTRCAEARLDFVSPQLPPRRLFNLTLTRVRRERKGSEPRVLRAAAIRVALESVLFSLSPWPVVPSSRMIGYYQPTVCGILVMRDEMTKERLPSTAVVDLAEYHVLVALYDVLEMSRHRARMLQFSKHVLNIAINIRYDGHAMPLITPNARGACF